ncbi:unnamed protein product, partial [marine sediment metagenome]
AIVSAGNLVDSDDRTTVEKLIRETRKLVSETHIVFSAGIGRRISHLRDAAVSYRDAIESVDTAGYGAAVWYDRIVSAPKAPYYPPEMQTLLIQQALDGYGDRVLSILEDIRDRNLKDQNMRHDEVRQLLYELRGTVLRLVDISRMDVDIELEAINGAYQKFELNHDASYVFDQVTEFYGHFCEIAGKRALDKTAQFRKTLVDFVDKNIADPNFGLKMVGVEFGLSEKYLSAVFKEHTGENFGTYVENRRMQRALDLLKDSTVE